MMKQDEMSLAEGKDGVKKNVWRTDFDEDKPLGNTLSEGKSKIQMEQ